MKLRLVKLVSDMFIETESVRRVDDLGRIVIPKTIREKIGINDGDPFVICYNDRGVFFKKYNDRENRTRNAIDIVCSECSLTEDDCDFCPVMKIYDNLGGEIYGY